MFVDVIVCVFAGPVMLDEFVEWLRDQHSMGDCGATSS
jgi:hypothetical protein